MVKELLAAWVRPACAFFGLVGILVLTGCGGGSGAPNNPYEPPPPPILDLTLIPGAATIYPGTPFTLTAFGGVPPYRAFTTDATILPVPLNVSGDTIVLFANPVAVATRINIGIQDARGVIGRDSVITVVPAPLLPSGIIITGNPSPSCDSTDNTVCSGGTGTATVKLTGLTGAALPGRPVRFDVVQGTFQFVSTNPAQPLVPTLTVTTDGNGNAVVILAVPPDTPTQTGIIRATDITTGQQITGTFSILQATIDGAVLSILPLGTTTITGPDNTHCSSGVSVTYFIFGGTPPYTVNTNFPQAVTLTGVPVTRSGGSFTVTTNGTCFTNLTFVISDATGRVIPAGLYPLITNTLGTGVIPPTPQPFVVTPGAIARNNCVPSNTFQFIATGGTAPYSAVVSSTTSTTSPVIAPQTGIAQGQGVTVSGITSPSTTVITIFDNSVPRQSNTVTIDCAGGPVPPAPPVLVVQPNNYDFTMNPGTCVNQIANFVVFGGSPPYTVFFATPRPGATITPTTVNAAGEGFQVIGLTDGVLTTNITVQDASTPPRQAIVTITCPTVPLPPGLLVSPGTYTYVGAQQCTTPSVFTIGTTGALPPPMPPFTVFFSTPGTPGTIAPTTVGALGGTFTVTVPGTPIPRVTQITVQDSSPIPQFQNVFIDCRQ